MTSTKRNLELFGTAFFLAIAVAAIVLAFAFPPASRIVPTAIGVAMIVVALFQFVTILLTQPTANVDSDESDEEEDPESGPGVVLLLNSRTRKRTTIIIIFSAMLIGLIPLVGYPLAIGTFLLVSLLTTDALPKWGAVVCASAGFTVVYALFTLLLELEPFTGLAFDFY